MKNEKYKISDFFLVMIGFVHNFQVFLNDFSDFFLTASQKMLNALNQIFKIMSFFYAILSFWVMVEFVFYLCSIQSELRNFF